jgi:hypothetical protein
MTGVSAEQGTGLERGGGQGQGGPEPGFEPGPGSAPVSGSRSGPGADPGPGLTGAAAGAPLPRGVPAFAPVRAGGGRLRLRRGLRKRRRAVAAGLAITAAALTAAMPDGEGTAPVPARADRVSVTTMPRQPPEQAGNGGSAMVRAPVRIADAGVVQLLRPGDRVDVLARARVVASGASVVTVPDGDGGGGLGGLGEGALVVLSVPRATAVALAGASARSPLMVVLV